MTLFTAHMPFLKLLTFTRQPWDKRWRHNGLAMSRKRRELHVPIKTKAIRADCRLNRSVIRPALDPQVFRRGFRGWQQIRPWAH